MGTRASAGMPKCGYGHHKHQLTESLSHTKRWMIHSARCFVTAGSITSNYLMWNFHHCPRFPHLWSYVSSYCGIESCLEIRKSLDFIACLLPKIVGIDATVGERTGASLLEMFGMKVPASPVTEEQE